MLDTTKTAIELFDRVKQLVDDTRELASAVKNEKDYLRLKHPEAIPSLVQMLTEINETVKGLGQVSSLFTHFIFILDEKHAYEEAARFRDHIGDTNRELHQLRSNLRELRGSCGKVREARDKLSKIAAGQDSWSSWLRLFPNRRRELDNTLAGAVGQFYADDEHIIDTIQQGLDLAQAILDEAGSALSAAVPDSMAGLRAAAAVLNREAERFRDQNERLNDLADQLDTAIRDL